MLLHLNSSQQKKLQFFNVIFILDILMPRWNITQNQTKFTCNEQQTKTIQAGLGQNLVQLF